MKPLELSSQFGNSSNDSGSCVGGPARGYHCAPVPRLLPGLPPQHLQPLGVLFYFAMGSHWPFGRFLCQVKIALLSSHFYGGTIFLTLISIHRYAAVVHFNRRGLVSAAPPVSHLRFDASSK
ncbi:hypothetical protein CesoFtcFv8_003076 [Champsocephalus esox]|uniref:G-protein coupled receptors family 1 profile domain-containing protein n=2 Tax=Champsocephalus TaxID=52236 RepID=A0AAN8HX90_CHAGU|nr:hypothetical protein CesoFtcFv8_003076 [Champsocephalus esox]KAK5931746.1 hypothetical protein CgunFtcFv8_003517 [Champsocephalus gunnari]